MKRLFLISIIGLMLGWMVGIACTGSTGTSGPPTPTIEVTSAGNQPVDLAPVARAALACSSTVTWTLQEASRSGFNPAQDGSVSAAGVYTPPTCGSTYAGATQHVFASGCGKSVIIAITSAPTASTAVSLTIPDAIGYTNCATAPSQCLTTGAGTGLCLPTAGTSCQTNADCTAGTCQKGGYCGTAAFAACDPTSPNTNQCATATQCTISAQTCTGNSVQFYYQVWYTCGGQQYATAVSPALPSTLPPACPAL